MHEASADFLRDMVLAPEYPCLGARSVVQRDRAFVHAFGELGSQAAAVELFAALATYTSTVDTDGAFASFVATFDGPLVSCEHQFEALLWQQLQLLHDLDDAPWAAGVSSDPTDPGFAFSVAGTAFFVVGLHPAASRAGRRAPRPTLVFNLHSQFEALRARGRYPRMRDAIRSRDVALQGSINPMASDHGAASEACQYSGRAVPPGWAPRFTPRTGGAT